MSQNDLERRLTAWLDSGPDSAPPDVVSAAVAAARRERQVRVIDLPWRRFPRLQLPNVRTYGQAAAAFAVLALAVIVAAWGLNQMPSPPAGSSPSPSRSAAASASASPAASPSTSSGPSSTPSVAPRGGIGQIAAGQFDDVAIAVDASGHLHVAAAIGVGAGSARGIVYVTDASGSWTSEQLTTAPAGPDGLEYDGEPDIAVDRDGSVWIAFTRYDCAGCTPTISNSLLVMDNAAGAWSTPEQVAGAEAYGPTLAVHDGVAHIAFAFGQMPEQQSYSSYYATNASGRWVSKLLAPNADKPRLELGADAVPVVVYSTPKGIEMSSFAAGGEIGSSVVPGPDGPVDELLFVLDSIGQSHVLWADASSGMHEVVLTTTAGWTGPVAVVVDRLRFDSVAIRPENGELIASARSLDENGTWLVGGHNAAAHQVNAATAAMTDLVWPADRLYFVYALTGQGAGDGIWYTDGNTE